MSTLYNRTYTHFASTFLYTPLTADISTGWLVTPASHTTLASNASLRLDWTGRGIQVYGSVTNGAYLFSLDGSPLGQATAPVSTLAQQTLLLNYSSLPFASHSITLANPDGGGNLTITGASINYAKGEENLTGMIRTIPATIPAPAPGNWTPNPEFIWTGDDWMPDVGGPASPPAVVAKPRTLASLNFNVTECTSAYLFGLNLHSYTINIDTNSRPLNTSLLKRTLAYRAPSPSITAAASYETMSWGGDLNRFLVWDVEVDVLANGGSWGLSRIVVCDGLCGAPSLSHSSSSSRFPSSSATHSSHPSSSPGHSAKSDLVRDVVIGVVVAITVLLFLIGCCLRFCRKRIGRASGLFTRRKAPNEAGIPLPLRTSHKYDPVSTELGKDDPSFDQSSSDKLVREEKAWGW